jgi:hypothetical protein
VSRTSFLEIVANPAYEVFRSTGKLAIGGDSSGPAAGHLADLINECLIDIRERKRLLAKFGEISRGDRGVDDLQSGNGPNTWTDGEVLFFDHGFDYTGNRKATVPTSILPELIEWTDRVLALGFPNADMIYPKFEFPVLLEGPQAEKEFLLKTGLRWNS